MPRRAGRPRRAAVFAKPCWLDGDRRGRGLRAQQLGDAARGERLREVVALAELAAQLAQHLALLRQLDPLGERPQVERLAQADDRVCDAVLVGAARDDAVDE